MDDRSRWVRRALVGVVLALGCGESGPPRGELGLASFLWICDEGADYGCGRDRFPDDIAVGSTFEAGFDVARDGVRAGYGRRVEGASPTWIGPAEDGTGITARAEGEVALLAVGGGTLIDFTMVDLHEVSRVGLRRPAEEAPDCLEDDDKNEREDQWDDDGDEPEPCMPGGILDRSEDPDAPFTILEIEPQTARLLEAIPLSGSLPLAGRFDYTWTSLDPTRLVVSPRERGRVWLDFRGPELAELQVTTNDASYVVGVRAPASDEVPDPHRTGGRDVDPCSVCSSFRR
ncbi:MAG: hypothetical protein AAGF11_49475 [Myxococcota bacterium]